MAASLCLSDYISSSSVAASRRSLVGCSELWRCKRRHGAVGSVRCAQKRESQIDSKGHETDDGRVDRREAMASMATGGLLLGLMLQGAGAADAAPIVPPDLGSCSPASVNSAVNPSTPTKYVDCCLLPPKRPIVDFVPPGKTKPVVVFRKRRPAHRVNAAYAAKYERAYELMRALPDDDPRSLRRQADIHCAFCNGAYSQLGSSNKLQVHFSWLFLPWHRWYLYFHERILGHLIGDPKFALVFWNWDDQSGSGGNVMPAMFTDNVGGALYDAKRNPAHLPPALNTLSLSDLGANTGLDNEQIIQDNLNVLYQSIVTASTPDLFMGKKYSNGDPEPNIGGTLENAPHTAIHAWTGDSREAYLEDMGNFYSAARDPMFYAHHANVDRLWAVWNAIGGGRRRDHTDPDFLGAQFAFYDEAARLVRVSVRDALDPTDLGVSYESVKADKLWLNYEPQPLATTTTTTTTTARTSTATTTTGSSASRDREEEAAVVPRMGSAAENEKPVEVSGPVTRYVARPGIVPEELADRVGGADNVVEVLVLESVVVPRAAATHLAVFVGLPSADANTPVSCAEYVGSYVHIPHLFAGSSGSSSVSHSATVRFSISDNLRRIGLAADRSSDLLVTVVPKFTGGTPATIKGIKIEYE